MILVITSQPLKTGCNFLLKKAQIFRSLQPDSLHILAIHTSNYSKEFSSYCRHSFVKATQFFFISHGVHNDRERSEKVFKKRLYVVFQKMLSNQDSSWESSLRRKCQCKAKMTLPPTDTFI